MEFKDYIERQKEWSLRTFGEGRRTEGIMRHIERETDEVRQNPFDIFEYIDIIILAMDAAWRAGFSPEEIDMALLDKQITNMQRQWPDKSISEANQNEPTFHIKGAFE